MPAKKLYEYSGNTSAVEQVEGSSKVRILTTNFWDQEARQTVQVDQQVKANHSRKESDTKRHAPARE